MPTKPKKDDLPTTRRNVEKFFKSIRGRIWNKYDYGRRATKDIDAELERLGEEFNQRADVRALQKKRDAKTKEAEQEYNRMRAEVASVERHYYAKGLTPGVLKMIARLADDYADANTGEEE